MILAKINKYKFQLLVRQNMHDFAHKFQVCVYVYVTECVAIEGDTFDICVKLCRKDTLYVYVWHSITIMIK